MKKILACVLLLAMTLCLCSCGSSNNTGNDTEQNNEVSFGDISPSTALPAFADEFQVVLDNTDIRKGAINEAMGYVLAAYTTYDADTFCEYMYTKKPLDKMEDIADTISATASQLTGTDLSTSIKLGSYASDLLTAIVHLAGWHTHYAGYELELEEGTNIDDLVRAVNEYANIFYGQNIL